MGLFRTLSFTRKRPYVIVCLTDHSTHRKQRKIHVTSDNVRKTVTLSGGLTLPVAYKLEYTAKDLANPFRPCPAHWSWVNIRPGEAGKILAPSAFISEVMTAAQACSEAHIAFQLGAPRGDGRVQAVFWAEPDRMRSAPAGHDPLSVANVERVSDTIPADASPTGLVLRLTHKLHFTHADLRAHHKTAQIAGKPRYRYSWPFKDMEPGDAITLIAPVNFANQVAVTASSCLPRRDGSAVVRARRMPVSSDGRREVLIWCEATNQ
jgi:hypothetical protein